MLMTKEYESVTHMDEDGNLYIELPDALLNQMGWATGDTLEWIESDEQTWTITKKVETKEGD